MECDWKFSEGVFGVLGRRFGGERVKGVVVLGLFGVEFGVILGKLLIWFEFFYEWWGVVGCWWCFYLFFYFF